MEKTKERLTNRYNTMITNIKSMSNSYYDSYLDLLEETIICILDSENIEYDKTKSCGGIVRTLKVYNFFLMIGLSSDTVKKLPDYIKKCNDHKHKKEKNLNIDSVINYLSVYFTLVNTYLKFKQMPQITFDEEYYKAIFGETIRKNEELKKEVERLKEELSKTNVSKDKYDKIISSIEGFEGDIEDYNRYMLEQINALKDIKIKVLEDKLDKALDMLIDMKDYLVENRILQRRTSMLIDGIDITDDMLKEERNKK